MKTFMEEYGLITVAAIIIMIFVLVATPIGTALKNGVKTTVDKFTQSMVLEEDEEGENSAGPEEGNGGSEEGGAGSGEGDLGDEVDSNVLIITEAVGDAQYKNDTTITKLVVKSGSTIAGHAFNGCTNLEEVVFEDVTGVYGYAFANCSNLKTVTFKCQPNNLTASTFNNCSALRDIYVPWSEGEIDQAPWGATLATVYYNTVE